MKDDGDNRLTLWVNDLDPVVAEYLIGCVQEAQRLTAGKADG